MTTPTHDTAAALEAAIDALINAEDVDTRAIVASERGEPGRYGAKRVRRPT